MQKKPHGLLVQLIVLGKQSEEKRNTLLADTDWRFRSDMTSTQAWIDYCQALRDVTIQADPLNIVWPTEPVPR